VEYAIYIGTHMVSSSVIKHTASLPVVLHLLSAGGRKVPMPSPNYSVLSSLKETLYVLLRIRSLVFAPQAAPHIGESSPKPRMVLE
jgi:hypothetical protein